MEPAGLLEVRTHEETLERLVRLMIRQLADGPGDRERFELTVVEVITSIRRILMANFHDGELASEAADSVCRTLLRRIRDCELAFDGTTGIERFLVQTAFAKAYSMRTRQGWGALGDPVDSSPGPDQTMVTGEHQAERRELSLVMKRYLKEMLERMEPYLRNSRHREIFGYLLQGSYGGPRLTHLEIARRVRCSERTVERVHQTFEQRWRPLVEQARREFQDLVARLEGTVP
jgi:hypothetical protein